MLRQNERVSSTFPRTSGSVRGYDVEQVEAFLATARQAYTSDDAESTGGPVTSDSIRATAFDLVKGGYDAAAVDAAMERLEDAFAMREREHEIALVGEQRWNAEARAAAQELLDRLARPQGRRFRRTGLLTTGYRVGDVDAFADRVSGYLQRGERLTTDEVREVVFRAARRGYDEAQVDLLLDTVTRTMLAVR